MNTLLAHLLDAAGRAPSAHNTQPWLLRWRDDALEVRLRPERALPAVDPHHADALHAIGALLENLLLTLDQLGFQGDYETADILTPAAAVLTLRWRRTDRPPSDPTLYRVIPVRRTSRLPYLPEPTPAATLEALRAQAAPPTALHTLTDAERIARVRRLVADASVEQLADPVIARELYQWLRFSRRDRRWSRDGLNAACMGWGGVEAMLASWLLAPTTLCVLKGVGLLRRLLSGVDAQAPSAPTLCLLMVKRDDVATRIQAGRVLQRIWLTAAAEGLATHPLSAAVDLARTRAQTLELFGAPAGWPHVNLFRLGRSGPVARSARLPADEILECT
jgi:nitroreductase